MAIQSKKSGVFMFNFQKTANVVFILLLLNFSRVFADGRHKRQAPASPAPDPNPILSYRQAPICVDWENMHPEEKGLDRFTWIFEYYRNNIYIPVSDGLKSPSGLIKKFELSAVDVDDLDSGYKATLKNWVHIHIESEADLEGLYVQAISAPWGIPFGEFMTNFDCDDCIGSRTSDFKEFINVIPCTKRAALAYTHPNVFTVGGEAITDVHQQRKYFTRMHFNFRYTQYPGVDHTYAQFFVIAVRNFKGNFSRFETFFTQIYELDVQDNPIGAFYPFYAGWETKYINCHQTALSNDFKPYAGANSKLKLQINKNFDTCQQNMENDNMRWFTCPPGPIVLKQADIPKDLPEWQDLRKKYLLTGDPSVDPQYGTNPQFCPDAGIWDWTVGELEWAAPQVEVIMEGNLTLTLTSKVDVEQPNPDGYDCTETDSKVECVKDVQSLNASSCMDYHATACSQAKLDEYGIVPMHGKDAKGTYQLSNRLCSSLTMTEQVDVAGIRWGNKYILVMHGKLMIFAWTVAVNVMVFSARFMKEYSVIEKRSSYFGVGNWLWNHIIWSHIGWVSVFSGVYLVVNQHETNRQEIGSGNDSPKNNLHDLCNLHRSKNETDDCYSFERKLHGRVGTATVLFLFLSYISGWGRPINTFLRKLLIVYHYGMAYLGKITFYFIMYYGTFAKDHQILNTRTFTCVLVTDILAIIMFTLATVLNIFIDKKFAVEGRLWCPVPEGIDTYEFSQRLKWMVFAILPVHIIIQIVCFYVTLGTFELDSDDLCKEG